MAFALIQRRNAIFLLGASRQQKLIVSESSQSKLPVRGAVPMKKGKISALQQLFSCVQAVRFGNFV